MTFQTPVFYDFFMQQDEASQIQLARTLKVVWDSSIRDYPPEELRRIFALHGVVEDVVIRSSKKKRQVRKG